MPGDLIVLAAGARVPADGRIVESARLQIEEAALTGESLPVTKTSELLQDKDAALGERLNMAFLGTTITDGRGRALVTATGAQSEVGKIGILIDEAITRATPLEQKLARLGRLLIMVVLVLCAVIVLAGWPQCIAHRTARSLHFLRALLEHCSLRAALRSQPLDQRFSRRMTAVVALEPSSPGVMKRSPRDPQEPLLTRRFVGLIAWQGLLLAGVTLLAFGIGLHWNGTEGVRRATTMAFMTLALAQVFHAFDARSQDRSVCTSRLFTNAWLWGAVAICLILQAATVYLPLLQKVLHTVPPTTFEWAVIAGCSLLPVAVVESVKATRRFVTRNQGTSHV